MIAAASAAENSATLAAAAAGSSFSTPKALYRWRNSSAAQPLALAAPHICGLCSRRRRLKSENAT